MRSIKKNTTIVLQLLLFSILTLLSVGCFNFDYAREMGKGNESKIKGDYDTAVLHYTEALKIARKEYNHYNEWETLGDLGRVYSAQNLNEKAEETFKERVSLVNINHLGSGALTESYVALTMHYLTKKKCQEATDSLSKMNENQNIVNDKSYKESIDILMALSRYKGCSS